jgi:UPF0716 protein FxsA
MAVLVFLFIVVPILEIYVIIQVGQAIGALWTIALLIADSIIGARLLGWQGRAAWRRFQEALWAGRVPHREVLDGAMILVGGTLLLTPGFITDVAGLALLLPPTRAFIRRALVRALRRPGLLTRVVVFRPGSPPPRGPEGPPGPGQRPEPHPPRLGSPDPRQPNRELPGG